MQLTVGVLGTIGKQVSLFYYEGYIKPIAESIKMTEMKPVFRLLKKKNVFANLTVGNKNELLNILISSFKEKVQADELQSIREAVFQREEMISTGVGNGIAIPHGKSSEIMTQHAALAILKPPVDYDSFDAQPVSIVFLYAGPDSQKHAHLNIISEFSKLMNNKNFRQELKQQQTRENLYLFLKEYS